jgi:uncharacterized membrane protein YoaK (UPF0700 family)
MAKLAEAQVCRAVGGALICGYVDSYALSTLGVYSSFMSGNTTSAGLYAGRGNLAAAGHNLLPIPFFLLGIFAAALFPEPKPGQDRETLLSALIACLLLCGFAAAYFGWPGWLSIVILSVAMGILGSSIGRVGSQSLSVGWITGDLNSMAQNLANGIRRIPVAQEQNPRAARLRRAALLAGVWVSFLLGAVLGGMLTARLAAWTLLIPAVILAVYALATRLKISGL